MEMSVSSVSSAVKENCKPHAVKAQQVIPPRTGVAFTLRCGEVLRVIDIEGEQVADFLCFNLRNTKEVLSSGRTLDYEETIFLKEGNALYSNYSTIMARITRDDVKRHDFLLTPCSRDTFRIIYGHKEPHHGCYGNLARSLEAFGITEDQIPTTFNIFMNVEVNGTTGAIQVKPPLSKAGQCIEITAEMDLIVGLTACSAEQSNNGSFKPVGYQIIPASVGSSL